MYNKVNGKRSLLTVPVHGSMAAKIFSENKVLEGFTFVNSARNLLCMHWYSSLIRPCLSRSIDRVFSLNKGDIWRACAFRDSKALGYRPTAAWSRGRPEPGRLWSRSHPVPIPKCKADMLPRHQHPCSCELNWDPHQWLIAHRCTIRYSHVQATRMSVWSILLGHGVTVSCGCVSQWSAWTVGHDMTVSTLEGGWTVHLQKRNRGVRVY